MNHKSLAINIESLLQVPVPVHDPPKIVRSLQFIDKDVTKMRKRKRWIYCGPVTFEELNGSDSLLGDSDS